MMTFSFALVYKLRQALNSGVLLYLVLGLWSWPTLAAVCPGGVSEQTTVATHTIMCSAADFSISSSVTVTKNGGLYQLTDLSNATAADAMGTPVNLNDALTDGTCYTFTSTDVGSIGAEYQGTIINAVGFTNVSSGACSGGGGPTLPVAPVITSATSTAISDYVVSGTHPVNGTIISVIIDANLNNLIDITESPATGAVVVSGGSWTTAPISISGDTRFLVVANDPISGLPSSVVIHDVSYNPTPTNTAPTITGSPTTSVNEDSPYSFTPTASDPDAGSTLTFSIANKPTWASFNTATGALTGTPGNEHVGSTQGIVISVSDGTASAALSAFSLTVVNVNDAPVISGSPAISVNEDSLYSFTPTASDPDAGSTLTFSIANKPTWASFNSATGALTGMPGNEHVGSTQGIVISVSDGTASASLPAFNLIVVNVNDAPVISGSPAISVNEDSLYSFTPTASDPDAGSTLTFSIANKPTWASFNTATGALTGTPGNAHVGTTQGIVISVSDGTASAALSAFSLTVVNVNDAPVITGSPAISVNEDSLYSFTPAASDADAGTTLTFSIANKPTWASFNTATGAFTGTPGNEHVGMTQGIVISVSDGTASASLAAFNLTVVNVNDTPALTQTVNWQLVGAAGFSADLAISNSLALAPDGTPYLAYMDFGRENKATVMKFNGSNWQAVGGEGFTTGTALYTRLVIAKDGVPYLAYSDGATNDKATVMKFNGSSWELVGTAGFSAGKADFVDLAFTAEGVPYVAYRDGASNNKATVMKFTDSGWEAVGTVGFTAGQADDTSLALAADGTPYLAYTDYANGAKASVMKFNGTSWQVVGIAGFSAGFVGYINLALSPDGTPYVAYRDQSNANKATVMKLNGGSWQITGTVGLSAGQADYISLKIAADGTPYLAYQDGGNSSKAIVMKFNGSDWQVAGTAGFSAGAVNRTSLALASDGSLYVAYSDGNQAGKATVMTLPSMVLGTTLTLIEDSGTPYLLKGVVLTDIDSDVFTLKLTLSDKAAGRLIGTAAGNAQLRYDPETGVLTLTGSIADVNASLASIAFIPAANYTGTFSFLFDLSDGQTDISPITTVISVTAVNDAPVITGSPDTSADEDSLYSFIPTVNDPDDATTTLRFSINKKPTWTNFNEQTGELTGTPGIEHVGTTENIVISVTDGKAAASLAAFNLTVFNVNDAPALVYAGSWQPVGGVGGAGGSGIVTEYSELELKTDGTTHYLLYQNQNQNHSASVTKFNPVHKEWQHVGNDTLPTADAYNPSLAVTADGTPYLAYRNAANGNIAQVMKFSATQNAWQVVGTSQVSAGAVTKTSLTIAADGVPYLAYLHDQHQDGSNRQKATILKFEGSSWQPVGDTGFSVEIAGHTPRLIVAANGTPYLAFGGGTRVRTLDGNRWLPVSEGGGPGDSIYGGASLAATADSVLYVAYPDSTRRGYVTVMKFTGSSWQPVGDPGFSEGQAQHISLALAEDGTPYVAYQDSANRSEVTVMKFSGNSWQVVGEVGLSAGKADYISLAFAGGTPYVAYRDHANGNKATVMAHRMPDLGATLNLTEDGGATPLLNGVVIRDIDSNNLTLMLTLSDPAAGTLSGTAAGNAQLKYDPATGQLTLTGSLADVNASLPSIVFTPAASYNGNFNFSLELSDGETAISKVTTAVEVADVNDVPTITGTPGTSVNEDSEYKFTPEAQDLDIGTILEFDILNKPEWASFDRITGVLTGTPGNKYVGSYKGIRISVSDGIASAALPFFDIEVVNVNDAPVATNRSATTAEDTLLGLALLAQDPDQDQLSYEIFSQPEHGTAIILGRLLVYTPGKDFNGTDSIGYVAKDAESSSAAATISLTVTAVNDNPQVEDDSYSLQQVVDNTYQLAVLANDSDVDGDTLTIDGASTSVGTVVFNAEGLTLTTSDRYVGPVSLRYTVTDSKGGRDTADVNLIIEGDSDLPVITVPADVEIKAVALKTRVHLGTATAVDSNGRSLSVSKNTKDLYFEPGEHTVYWQATDADGNTATKAQRVRVHPMVSVIKDQKVTEGSEVEFEVLLSGPSPVYPVFAAYIVSGSADGNDHTLASGVAEISSGLSTTLRFNVLEDALVEGPEDIIITLDDSVNRSSKRSSRLVISEANLAPVVSLTVQQKNEERLTISEADGVVTVTAKVTDANPQDQTTGVWNVGRLTNVTSDQTQLSFNPAEQGPGLYNLSYTATDNGSPNLSQTTSTYVVIRPTLATLGSDDADGDLIPDEQEGHADSDGDGLADYLDAINECNVMPTEQLGQTEFLAESDPGVCLRVGTVAAETDAGGLQIAKDAIETDDVAVNIGGIFDFIAYGLPDQGQSSSLVIPQRLPIPANAVYRKFNEVTGWVDFVSNERNSVASTAGERGFCPLPGDAVWTAGLTEGHWCVQVTVEDGGPNDADGMANSAIVDPGGVAVERNGNNLPVAVADEASVLVNTSVDVNVLANDTDVDSDALTVIQATSDFGTVTILADQQLSYTPPPDFIGVDTVVYSITDGKGGTASSEMVVNVFNNTAPVAVNDSASTDDRSPLLIAVLSNDTDAEGDVLTVTAASAQEGAVSIEADQRLRYTPKAGFDGVDTISYTVTDSAGDSATGNVSVTVRAYQDVVVDNKSSGGSMAWWMGLVLAGAVVWRRRSMLGVAAVALLGFSPLSQAEGWYLQGSVGHSKANQKQSRLVGELPSGTITGFDDSDSSYGLTLGYQLHPHVALEAGYLDLGEASSQISGESLTPQQYHEIVKAVSPVLVDGYTAGVRFTLWQNTNWSLDAPVGVLFWNSEIESRMNGAMIKTKSEGSDLYLGVQLNYQLSEPWKLAVGYQQLDLKPNDVNSWLVSLRYSF